MNTLATNSFVMSVVLLVMASIFLVTGKNDAMKYASVLALLWYLAFRIEVTIEMLKSIKADLDRQDRAVVFHVGNKSKHNLPWYEDDILEDL